MSQHRLPHIRVLPGQPRGTRRASCWRCPAWDVSGSAAEEHRAPGAWLSKLKSAQKRRVTQDLSDLWVIEEASLAALRPYSEDGLSSPQFTEYPTTRGSGQAQLDSEEVLEDVHFTTHTDSVSLIKYFIGSSAGEDFKEIFKECCICSCAVLCRKSPPNIRSCTGENIKLVWGGETDVWMCKKFSAKKAS